MILEKCKTLNDFKKAIKGFTHKKCVYHLCKAYTGQVGFIRS